MSQKLSHQLTDPNTKKLSILTLSGTALTVETGSEGKLKTTEKTFNDKEAASKEFIKKEWELLKKGYVLHNDNAGPGEPALHYYIGGGYTGALSFAATADNIYIYKNNGDYSANSAPDSLVVLSAKGDRIGDVNLPEKLAWDIAYNPVNSSLLMDLDYSIYEYGIEGDTFKQLAERGNSITSFITVADYTQAYAADDTAFVTDNNNDVLMSYPYQPEMVRGSVRFCAQLSADGQLLALHQRDGEIIIFNTAEGMIKGTITADFVGVAQMEFSKDSRLLIVREEYGRWGMRYFDTDTFTEIAFNELEVPEYTKEVNGFCLNANQSKLVLIQRSWVYVYDFVGKKLLHKFKADHVVKTLKAKFAGELLGIRSDYGCFSLYAV
ncbi:hypothetical protein [Mucilaginibacter conchicola]|nr:hypothetical protein [Mucilaginibacter conchicola]